MALGPKAPTWVQSGYDLCSVGGGGPGDIGGESSPPSSLTAQKQKSHQGTPTTEKTIIFLIMKARFTLDWASQTGTSIRITWGSR